MPSFAGIVFGASTWSGHSGGCSCPPFSLLERWRTGLPCASKISSVTSPFGAVLKVVVNDRARRRIGSGRLMRVDLLGIMETDRGLRLVQIHVGLRDLIVDLAQRRQVVEHPEGAAVGRHNKVVILHHQVVNRRDRQIQLQRLPMRRRHRTTRKHRVPFRHKAVRAALDLRAPRARRRRPGCRS